MARWRETLVWGRAISFLLRHTRASGFVLDVVQSARVIQLRLRAGSSFFSRRSPPLIP